MIRPAVVLTLALTALTGVVYPLAMTGLALAAFPRQARGEVAGAVGQAFTRPDLFHGRPSATTPPYDASSSAGSNLGPTNPVFLDAVRRRVAALRSENPDQTGPVPADLVTSSGSGLDPDVSVEGALWQVPRVARARGVPMAALVALIERHTEGRFLGIFGEPHVNVVRLNLALGALVPRPSARAEEPTSQR